MVGDSGRSVVPGFGGPGASALSVQAAAEQLVAQVSWPGRLALLDSDPRLVDVSIARWCAERGETLLAAVIERACEVGVASVSTELPAALALSTVCGDATAGLAESVRAVRQAATVVAGGAAWLQSLLLQAVEVLVARIRGGVEGAGADETGVGLLGQLRDIVEPLLARAVGCDPADVTRMLAWARKDWDKVWDALPTSSGPAVDADAAVRACSVAQVVVACFEADRRVADWVDDLGHLIDATRRRGADAAVREHHLVLTARAVPGDERVPDSERAEVCGQVAAECVGYFQRTGAVWVLQAALDTASAAFRLTPEDHPDRAAIASNLGSLLSEVVQVGIADPGVLAEAVQVQREAYRLIPEDHPNRAGIASNLGSRLSEAVQVGIADPGVLAEAVQLQREAYQRTPEHYPDHAMYASNLGSLLSQAVQAGAADSGVLIEAVQLQREAYQLTPKGHPDRAAVASNLGSLLSQAVQAGATDPGVLAEAVQLQREAYQLTPKHHPDRARRASDLGSLLARAVQVRVADPEVLTEAVQLQREAYQRTPEHHPNRAAVASNLGNLLARAVQAGITDPAVLTEAIQLQREAYQLTPEHHPNRAAVASNLGSRLSEAIQAGIADPEVLTETAQEAADLVDELWRLARGGVSPAHRRRLLSATQAAAGRLPLMLLRRGDAREAVRAVEALRGHLTGGMHAPALPPDAVDPLLAQAYHDAAAAYEATQTRAREGLTTYADALPAAARLAELVDQIRTSTPGLAGFGGRPRFDDLCAGLPPTAAGIYLLPAPDPVTPGEAEPWPGAAVIIRDDGRTHEVPLPELTRSAVAENAIALLGGSASAQRVCVWLWQAVAGPLLAHGGPALGGASEWVIIPSGHLGLLPLHAAGSTQTGWLDDHVTVRVTPSLLALTEHRPATTASAPPTVAISDARDLAFLAADRAIAQALIPDARPVAAPVTPDSVLQALVDVPVAVISGHAVHSLTEGGGLAFGHGTTDPPDTASLEAEVGPGWLTAAAVERLPLRERQWAFLSACSSGQTAVDLPEEAIGLTSAFRHAGFATVVATQWPVKDHIAFIALARFLQHTIAHPQDPVAVALRHTRIWLRTAKREDLLAWLNDLDNQGIVPADLTQRLRDWWIDCPETPYADPEDWAPYAATGH